MKIEFHTDNTDELLEPITVANALIKHTTYKECLITTFSGEHRTFNNNELSEIAMHLLTYCFYNKEKEE